MNNKKEASKNNRNRFVYSFLFIFILILVSIMYASLAINIGTKVKIPKIIEPTDKPVNIMPQTGEESAPITKRSRKRTKVDPVTPVVPVIEPDDINWKIEFDNVKIDSGSVRAVKDATIDSSKTEITYEVIMTEPGQFYSFKVDILNYRFNEYNREFYITEPYSKMNLDDAIEFSDLIFTSDLDKYYFLRQYAIKDKPKQKKLVI